MSEPIRGRVARLFNSRELALTVGRNDGVVTGMLFDILDPNYEGIRDPETREVLGSIDKAKMRVEVTRVEARVCLAATRLKGRVNVGGGGASIDAIGRLFAPPKWVTMYDRLDEMPGDVEPIDEHKSYVRVGDPVVQVFAAADDGEATDRLVASESEENSSSA